MECLTIIMANAIMKKSVLTVGSINDINETEPKTIKSKLVMPKVVKTKYTDSIYATIIPKMISIHAASLIFGQRKIAKKAATAPSINWLEI